MDMSPNIEEESGTEHFRIKATRELCYQIKNNIIFSNANQSALH